MDLAAIEATLKNAAGQRKVVEDYVAPAHVERLSATLESTVAVPRPGDALPRGWHTVFCLSTPARAALGEDGLASSDAIIPRVPMQRRMFGGARLSFHEPLRVGEPIRCESELADAKTRATPSSLLAIATVRHRYFGSSSLAVVEEQDIIHMEPLGKAADKPAGGSTTEPMPAATWQRQIVPDPVMLFRFSAITFNSHRIHYDAPYSASVERLPGLMVQGKLIALQLLETVRAAAPSARIESFEYRSGRPLFAGAGCILNARLDDDGRGAQLWATDGKGSVVQSAKVKFAEPVRA